MLAPGSLFSLLEEAGTFSLIVIVGLMLQVLCVISHNSGDSRLSCQHGTRCVCIEQKNPSGRIIPESANFVLNEFFGLKNRLMITLLLMIMW